MSGITLNTGPNTDGNQRDLKPPATRVFGYVALILGVPHSLLLILFLLGSRRVQLWTSGPALLIYLLQMFLAANLLYLGWHAIARGTIPIRPQGRFHWRDVTRIRTGRASISPTRA